MFVIITNIKFVFDITKAFQNFLYVILEIKKANTYRNVLVT